MKRILHLVSQSHPHHDTLARCLASASPQDGVLLLEEAVTVAISDVENKILVRPVYVLAPDLALRGLAQHPLVAEAVAVDYSQFVELVCDHELTRTWV